jgi:hypothetical protein
MSCLLGTSLFSINSMGDNALMDIPDHVIKRMKSESETPESLGVLSGTVYSQLRKVLNQERAQEIIGAIQFLATEGSPEGTRLLGAFLDVNTPGARLLPQVKDFNSSRRRRLDLLKSSASMGNYEKGWLHRLDLLRGRCSRVLKVRNIKESGEDSRPGHEAPWPVLRSCLRTLLLDIAHDKSLDDENRQILGDLLKLEIDSRQDRVSGMAGNVNPYNVHHIGRLLPILSSIDAEIRDLRQLVVWISEGQDKIVFNKPVCRGLEVMDANEFSILLRADRNNESISPLLELVRSQHGQPLLLSELAAGMMRLMALANCFVEAGLSDEEMDPVTAATLIHKNYDGNEVWIPLDPIVRNDVQQMLRPPLEGCNPAWWPLSDICIVGDQLSVPLTGADDLGRLLSGGLPSNDDVRKFMVEEDEICLADSADDDVGVNEDSNDDKEEDNKVSDDSSAAVSHLVMQNIQSMSVLLGFLHNPKITAIPGLVAKVAGRTRTPRIIETIATDRSLYSGFANRDVPLACLISPCNVSVKTLVKFIHVKYISKVDLRRMVKDKTGMRREVISEIEKYLDSLD